MANNLTRINLKRSATFLLEGKWLAGNDKISH